MKNLLLWSVGVVFGLCMGYYGFCIREQQSLDANMSLVKQSFDAFNVDNVEGHIAQYHSKDYVQHADGKELSYDDFVNHVLHLKSLIESPIEIIYDTIIAEGDYVCAAHRAKVVKKGGKQVEVKVIAVHKILNGKIVSVDELSSVMSGEESDKELASQH